MSCHARVGDDDDEFEFLDSRSVYGTSSICFSFLCERQLCFMLFVFVIKYNKPVGITGEFNSKLR